MTWGENPREHTITNNTILSTKLLSRQSQDRNMTECCVGQEKRENIILSSSDQMPFRENCLLLWFVYVTHFSVPYIRRADGPPTDQAAVLNSLPLSVRINCVYVESFQVQLPNNFL